MLRLHSLHIESIDLEGQGLAHHEGKVIFVEGALLGEVVDADVTRSKPSYAKARAVHWHQTSAQRVTPPCPHFGVCGGCAMQHLEPSAQLAAKQRALENSLWHIGRLRPEQILAPLDGPSKGYRSRARLTARWVDKKGGMLLGFHERRSSYVALMDSCLVLDRRVSEIMPALRDLLGQLSIARSIPQVEVAVGDQVIVWVLRILAPLSAADEERLKGFSHQWGVQFWLQPGAPNTARPFYPPDAPPLDYRLPEFDLVMPFSPVNFTQVNPAMNEVMVRRALALLDPAPSDRVADFFCGLGNFTLALARRAAQVVGYEGVASLTDQAKANAISHGLSERVQFSCVNLFEVSAQWLEAQGDFNAVLLDPPREGAGALCQAYAALHQAAARLPSKMVYVSCNPATLARDAAILVHEGGWRLTRAGIINMFPHTAHVESVAVFERDESVPAATKK